MRTKAEKEVGIFYHATAKENRKSILCQGLKIDQRGKNPYGLDTGVDYEKVYAGSTIITKPPCIHLTSSYKTAKRYKSMIEDERPAVILKIRLDLKTHQLIQDPESGADSFYCIKDIPKRQIKSISPKRNCAKNKSIYSPTANVLNNRKVPHPPTTSIPAFPSSENLPPTSSTLASLSFFPPQSTQPSRSGHHSLIPSVRTV